MCKTTRLAATALKEIDFGKQRHNLVAILERGGRIISIGLNDMNRTHPVYFGEDGENYDRGIHAEYDAVRQVDDPAGSNLHVFRFKRNGEMGASKPCGACMRLLKDKGVRKVIYFDKGKFVRQTLV